MARLMQAGYLREAGPGLYIGLPLFQALLQNLATFCRRIIAPAGLECGFPVLEATRQDGTSSPASGGEGFILTDSRGNDLRLNSPPALPLFRFLSRELNSYRQLPLTLFQTGPVFRSECQPRAGLAAARQFVGLQTWHLRAAGEDTSTSQEEASGWLAGLQAGLCLPLRWAEGESINGAGPVRYLIVLDPAGFTGCLICSGCQYTALAAWAGSRLEEYPQEEEWKSKQMVYGPGLVQVRPLAEFLGIPVWKTTKTLLFLADGRPVALMLRGDSDASLPKLQRRLSCKSLALAPATVVEELTGAQTGYAGPVGLPERVTLLADEEIRGRTNFECGANRSDHHLINVNFVRDLPCPEFGDFKQALAGHRCPRCRDGRLMELPAIQAGVFRTIQSSQLQESGCSYLDRSGASLTPRLESFCLDLFSLTAALASRQMDGTGLAWPAVAAPFQVHLILINQDDEAVNHHAGLIRYELGQSGITVLMDDRDLRPGEKFTDAGLLGLPVQLVLSRRLLNAGHLELAFRPGGDKATLPEPEALGKITRFLNPDSRVMSS